MCLALEPQMTEWPKPPIRPEHLPLIEALMTEEEYAEFLGKLGVKFPFSPECEVRSSSVTPESFA